MYIHVTTVKKHESIAIIRSISPQSSLFFDRGGSTAGGYTLLLLAASAFGGFPMADIPQAGMSTVVVTNGDRAAAETARDHILSVAWSQKEDFIWRDEPLEQAIANAKQMEQAKQMGQAKQTSEGPILQAPPVVESHTW